MQESQDAKKNKKDPIKELEALFQEEEIPYISYEKIAQTLEKAPTPAQVKKVKELAKKYDKQLMSSSEVAKRLNLHEIGRASCRERVLRLV